MARKTQDEDNKELDSILQDLLQQNVDITAREIARRHSSLSSASTITRHPKRRQLLEKYQELQTEMRNWQTRLGKKSKDQVAEVVTVQQAQIEDLGKAVRTLVTGHVALIAAVAQVGGMSKLSKFYESFRDVRNQLSDLGAIPSDGVTPQPVKFPDARVTSNGDK